MSRRLKVFVVQLLLLGMLGRSRWESVAREMLIQESGESALRSMLVREDEGPERLV